MEADVEIPENDVTIQLCRAICPPDNNMVKKLVDGKADVNQFFAPSDCPWTPLMYAAVWRNLDALKILLSAKADLNICDRNNSTAWDIITRAHGRSNDPRTSACIDLLSNCSKIQPAPEAPSPPLLPIAKP